jgi:hypothetical protein
MANNSSSSGGGYGIPDERKCVRCNNLHSIYSICDCLQSNEYRLAAEKAHPYIITHSNLTFDKIPSVSGVPIVRQFLPVSKYPSPLNFETDEQWETIKEKVEEYFDANGIPYCLPDTNAVFSISGISSDSNLIFDIRVCRVLKETEVELQKYVIEFRRVRGDAFILSRIFLGIKALLVEEEEEEEEEEENDEAQEGELIASAGSIQYNGEYLNYDDLNK